MLLLWDPLQVQDWPTFSFHTMKKADSINVLQNLSQVFIENMLMIFLYFLNNLNFRFGNICSLNTRASLSFLDIKISRKNKKNVINYKSFIPTYQKRGLQHTLLHRSFSIRCNLKTFHLEIDHLKTVLRRTIIFRISLIRSFLNKLYTPKVIFQNVPKRGTFVKLTFLGSTSFQIRKKL